MKDAKKEAKRWLLQADDDLKFVNWVWKEGIFFDKGCFISQQAGEKVLKACLYSTGKRFVVGHSLFEMVIELEKKDILFQEIRNEAIKIVKRTMDLTLELNAYSVMLWPAHDGFDYVFESDYDGSWHRLIESLNEIGEYNRKVRIAIEYKQKDPRAKSYISNIGKLMFLM